MTHSITVTALCAALLVAMGSGSARAAQPAGQQIGAVIAPSSDEREAVRRVPVVTALAPQTPAAAATPLPAMARPAALPRPWGGLRLDINLPPARP